METVHIILKLLLSIKTCWRGTGNVGWDIIESYNRHQWSWSLSNAAIKTCLLLHRVGQYGQKVSLYFQLKRLEVLEAFVRTCFLQSIQNAFILMLGIRTPFRWLSHCAYIYQPGCLLLIAPPAFFLLNAVLLEQSEGAGCGLRSEGERGRRDCLWVLRERKRKEANKLLSFITLSLFISHIELYR